MAVFVSYKKKTGCQVDDSDNDDLCSGRGGVDGVCVLIDRMLVVRENVSHVPGYRNAVARFHEYVISRDCSCRLRTTI